nr:hypothetical protein [Candidatus Sigynarchaeum springense]
MKAEYRNTISYRRFASSRVCMIMLFVMYSMIEAMWLGLGYFLRVDILWYMALYGNIPFAIMSSAGVGYCMWTYRQYKKKVADGTIKDDTTIASYGTVLSTYYAMGDATLSPEEKKVKGLIQMYPKITMADLAAKAGIPAGQIEETLLKLVSNGNIKGHVDPGTGEFISGMIDTTRVKPVDDAIFDCPHCGAVMKSAPVKGTSVRCASCGNLIVVN